MASVFSAEDRNESRENAAHLPVLITSGLTPLLTLRHYHQFIEFAGVVILPDVPISVTGFLASQRSTVPEATVKMIVRELIICCQLFCEPERTGPLCAPKYTAGLRANERNTNHLVGSLSGDRHCAKSVQ
jgi:hypothetical protein